MPTKDYLNLLDNQGINPDLERMRKLFELLDHPEKKIKAIHVTGTNGKGSVCAMLEMILRSSGYKTALYTSPHLVDVRERIQVAGKKITLSDFTSWLHTVQKKAESLKQELTFFEILTAIAFSYFAHAKIDIAVLEVGLGGRWDATNLIPNPEISIITNISLEHTDYLGATTLKITREKCGIIKKNGICITGLKQRSLLREIKKSCRKKNSKLITEVNTKTIPSCNLKGFYQTKNIQIVLKTVEILKKQGWFIPGRALTQGLQNVHWPCRFDWRNIKIGQKKIPMLLDAAHNPGACLELIASIKKTKFIKKKCLLIFNALKDKDISSMAKTLSKNLKLSSILIPRLKTLRSSETLDVKKIFSQFLSNSKIRTFTNFNSLWHTLKNKKNELKFSWILMTGSHYLFADGLTKVKRSEVR
ncbi:MAG: bifunctional folylpolyglutamate synthase/dihydrofolate synthase [Elusimicrobia bacterium]|nr:bifunctional folylpolyglutamate synthase/dihydrofolate synthase [Elusimicrobiota bacterium]